MVRILFLISLILYLTSCDPGFSVILNNKSSTPATAKIISSHRYTVFKDSIQISDTSKLAFYSAKVTRTKIPVIENDTASNSFAFNLSNGKRALIAAGVGFPDLNQEIIINSTDTIVLRKDKRVKIKNGFMGTTVTIQLD